MRDASGADRTETVWRESRRIPVYLMVIAAAPLERYDLGDTACGLAEVQRCVPQSVYTAPEQRGMLPGPFARAGEIVQLFAELVGPFPYEKLAHLQSSTRFGGMENASEIFYSDGAFRRRTMNDGLIAHETAHQWFGDAVTERDWAHLWLSEGFATYFAALWTRAARGDSAFRAQMAGVRRTVLADTTAVTHRPVIDTIETNYLALLNRNSYEKGGFVLHMLRAQVGERAFFDALRSYYAKHKHSTAVTDDLRAEMERESKQQLGWFFDQWLKRPGYPEVTADWSYDADDARSRRSRRSKDRGSARISSRSRWPPSIRLASMHRATITMSGNGSPPPPARIPLASPPAAVVLDPDVSLLAALTVGEAMKRILVCAARRVVRVVSARARAIGSSGGLAARARTSRPSGIALLRGRARASARSRRARGAGAISRRRAARSASRSRCSRRRCNSAATRAAISAELAPLYLDARRLSCARGVAVVAADARARRRARRGSTRIRRASIAPDSVLTASYRNTGDSGYVGRLPIRVNGHVVDARHRASRPRARAVRLRGRRVASSHVRREGRRADAEFAAAADSIGIGRLVITNAPVRVAPIKVPAIIGLDELARFAPTFDRARQPRDAARVRIARATPASAMILSTLAKPSEWLVLQANGWLSLRDTASRDCCGASMDARRQARAVDHRVSARRHQLPRVAASRRADSDPARRRCPPSRAARPRRRCECRAASRPTSDAWR